MQTVCPYRVTKLFPPRLLGYSLALAFLGVVRRVPDRYTAREDYGKPDRPGNLQFDDKCTGWAYLS
jgi:hypothetical protein